MEIILPIIVLLLVAGAVGRSAQPRNGCTWYPPAKNAPPPAPPAPPRAHMPPWSFPALLLCPLLLTGCDISRLIPAQPEPKAQILVEPATGGGGDVKPAELPVNINIRINKEITEQQAAPKADPCGCGCGLDRGQCGPECGHVSQPKQTTAPAAPVGYQTYRDAWGRQSWTVGQTQWFMPQHRPLYEGETDPTGRWTFRNGRMLDNHAAGVQSPPRTQQYVRTPVCDGNSCRWVYVPAN